MCLKCMRCRGGPCHLVTRISLCMFLQFFIYMYQNFNIQQKVAVSCLVSGSLNVFALPGSRPRVAPTAAKLEEARKQKLQELQEMFKPLQANPANQKVCLPMYHNVDLILALQHSEYINIDLPSV